MVLRVLKVIQVEERNEGISSEEDDEDEGDSDELSEEDIAENPHGHTHNHNIHRFFEFQRTYR